MDFVTQIQEMMQAQLPGTLGIQLVSVDPSEVVGTLVVEERICTLGSILHGGAVMAFADTLGAVGAAVNLKGGETTTTVESKTNFLRAAKVGTTVKGVSRLINKGRTLMLWQTELRDEEERLVAVVSQSQIILAARPS